MGRGLSRHPQPSFSGIADSAAIILATHIRLHKDRLKLYIKELGTLAVAAMLVAVAVACCLFFLFNPQSSTVEKDWRDRSSCRF